jgi:hypothetical protein
METNHNESSLSLQGTEDRREGTHDLKIHPDTTDTQSQVQQFEIEIKNKAIFLLFLL